MLAAGCLACVALLAIAGCSSGGETVKKTEETATVGAHMAGAVVDVNVTQEAIDKKPQPRVLTTPKSAVQSYLDWTSYAYRIGQSDVARPTMSAGEEVRVDSYIQYNIQKDRLIDQTLESITFGTPSIKGSRATLPAKEKWTYRYVSIKTAGETIGGVNSASYDTTYTLVKSKNGDWVVDSVDAEALDKVK